MSTPSPDVSVIVTAHNVSAYIHAALHSALIQNDVTLEVIVIDDASTDDTWRTIEAVTDNRITAVRLSQNVGPGAARNKAIALAKGEWIAVLDGDDQFLPDRLSHCISRARETQADCMIDNIQVYREADSATRPMFPPVPFSKIISPLSLADFISERVGWRGGYTLGYSKPIIKRSFLERHSIRYDETLMIGEDYRLMFEILAAGGNCTIEPQQGYRYTVRKGSISHRLSMKSLESMMASDNQLSAHYPLNAAALIAQKRRQRYHQNYHVYLRLIDAIKNRQLGEFIRLGFAKPCALKYLREPLVKRLTRAAQ